MSCYLFEEVFVCLFVPKTTISFVGPVTEVKTDIFVTSFGPVSDVEMVCNTLA